MEKCLLDHFSTLLINIGIANTYFQYHIKCQTKHQDSDFQCQVCARCVLVFDANNVQKLMNETFSFTDCMLY
jgi:hypothetical protein